MIKKYIQRLLDGQKSEFCENVDILHHGPVVLSAGCRPLPAAGGLEAVRGHLARAGGLLGAQQLAAAQSAGMAQNQSTPRYRLKRTVYIRKRRRSVQIEVIRDIR